MGNRIGKTIIILHRSLINILQVRRCSFACSVYDHRSRRLVRIEYIHDSLSAHSL